MADTDTARATVTALASTAASQVALVTNTARKGLTAVNTDANTCYLKCGEVASATSFTVAIPSGATWEMPWPPYTGRVDAIWAANGAGSLVMTEFT